MNIAVHPHWTFEEALEAAWKAYSGGLQFGVPNRIRVLEQWANVVGRERAVSELDSLLRNYKNIETASKETGLSKYALGKLRKSFKRMPALTPSSAEPETLYELLKQLPELQDETELAFMVRVMPKLSRLLGYADSEMYLEPTLAGHYNLRPDAVLGTQGPTRPRIIIEVKRSAINVTDQTVSQLRQYCDASKTKLGLILNPNCIVLLSDGVSTFFSISTLIRSEALRLFEILKRPTDGGEHNQAAKYPVSTLTQLLQSVVAAKTNDEKKKTLEYLAELVFESHPFTKCKYKNLQTRSSEIDLVCEFLPAENNHLHAEYGRYFFVECKNWNKPAGAKEIRDFLGKLRKARVRLGVFFSRSGITGEEKGTDALREIHSAFDQNGISVVVMAITDIAALKMPADIIEVMDAKLDALRFDF